jgi:hypothetical protein
MEFLRYKADAWGQKVLEGTSWDLLWLFVAAAVIFIVYNAVYTRHKLRQRHDNE